MKALLLLLATLCAAQAQQVIWGYQVIQQRLPGDEAGYGTVYKTSTETWRDPRFYPGFRAYEKQLYSTHVQAFKNRLHRQEELWSVPSWTGGTKTVTSWNGYGQVIQPTYSTSLTAAEISQVYARWPGAWAGTYRQTDYTNVCYFRVSIPKGPQGQRKVSVTGRHIYTGNAYTGSWEIPLGATSLELSFLAQWPFHGEAWDSFNYSVK